jgi:hypothetical protein
MRIGLILSLLIAVPCWSQTTTTGKATTSGSCSPANTGSNNTFTIKCGIGQKQGQQMLDILNKILANKLDSEQVMAKLDEIQKAMNSRPNVSAPNGIAIGGGTVSNPTVNNFVPPARRLSEEQREILVSCLKTTPGKFTVAAIANNGEAYRYAQDWSEVLSSAGWTNEQPIPVAAIMIAAGMWSGVHFSLPGSWDDITQHASIVDGSPEKKAFECINNAHVAGAAIPYKDMATGRIRVDVSEHP